jgi:hypothetical protein
VKPPVRSEPQRYAEALDDLWERLATTLPALEALARDPVARVTDGELLDALPALQYALHAAGEAALGIEPPAGAAGAHAEFASALAYARDVTAEVAEAIEVDGARAAQILQWEWRGAIFRVRLARLRLAEQTPAPPPMPVISAGLPAPRAALLALLLVVAGAIAVVTGAQLDIWPLSAGGLSLSLAAVVIVRTNP